MPCKCDSGKVACLLGVLLLSGVARAEGATASPSAAEVRVEDVELVDPEGAPVKLRSEALGDGIVVVDFVFTRCTTVCPVLSTVLGKVQEALGDRLGKEVRLVTISLDPTRDTPARMKAQATRYQARAGWRWLTGSQENVKQALQGLGAATSDVVNHAPMVLVGDARTGAWFRFNGFPRPEQVLAKVDALAEARRKEADRSREYFTDTPLLNQEGRTVRFYSDVLKDKVVVISFLFTRCPSACPLLTRKLLQMREKLGEPLAREVSFIVISVDPTYDTPQRWKEFARKHGATQENWTFLTGRKEDVDPVLKRLGQYVESIEEHSTMFIAGNVKRRHWAKLRPDATPEVLAERVRLLAARE